MSRDLNALIFMSKSIIDNCSRHLLSFSIFPSFVWSGWTSHILSLAIAHFASCVPRNVLAQIILTVRSASCRTRQWIRAVRPRWAVTLRETLGSNDGQTFGSSQKEMGLEGGSIGLPDWIDDNAPAPDVFRRRKGKGRNGNSLHGIYCICIEPWIEWKREERRVNEREKSIRELVMMGIVTRWTRRKGESVG